MNKPDFATHTLIPVVVQNVDSGRVLMLAYMNSEAFELTESTGMVHFWSRSRQEIWHKGSTSGNFLEVNSIEMDCDSDTLLVHVRPAGPSCHTGTESCFDTFQIELPSRAENG